MELDAPNMPHTSVVVASHGRPARLAVLLEALAGQTLPSDTWELIVVHTYQPSPAVLRGDSPRAPRNLREIRVDVSRASPAFQRNVGWRAARGRLVAFTDDDCRPEPDWLDRLVTSAAASPGAIVQGATRPDSRELHNFSSVHARTVEVDPPGPFAQTCNILYGRAQLERVGGFDEEAVTGEDIDLALRVRADGATLVGEPRAVVYHAVEPLTMRERIRSNRKWRYLPYVVKNHPSLRARCLWGVWWKVEHAKAVLALIGLLASVRRPWALLAVLPYYRIHRHRFGKGPRASLGRARRIPEMWLVDIAEVGTFVEGSIRYRTLLL